MNDSALGTLGKRVIAWILLVAAALLVLKLAIGAVMGFLTMVLGIAVIAAIGAAVIWALRHL